MWFTIPECVITCMHLSRSSFQCLPVVSVHFFLEGIHNNTRGIFGGLDFKFRSLVELDYGLGWPTFRTSLVGLGDMLIVCVILMWCLIFHQLQLPLCFYYVSYNVCNSIVDKCGNPKQPLDSFLGWSLYNLQAAYCSFCNNCILYVVMFAVEKTLWSVCEGWSDFKQRFYNKSSRSGTNVCVDFCIDKHAS